MWTMKDLQIVPVAFVWLLAALGSPHLLSAVLVFWSRNELHMVHALSAAVEVICTCPTLPPQAMGPEHSAIMLDS